MVATHSTVSRVEVLPRLTIGSIVRLPDESIAEVVWHSLDSVHVVHEYLRLAGFNGAGPWIFDRSQVKPATPDERRSYHAAVAAASSKVLVWVPMVRS